MNDSWESTEKPVERKNAALADFSSEDDHPGSNSISDYEGGNLVPAPPSIDSSPTEEDYEKYDQEVALAQYKDEQPPPQQEDQPENNASQNSASNEIEEELAKVLQEAKIASASDVEKARAQIRVTGRWTLIRGVLEELKTEVLRGVTSTKFIFLSSFLDQEKILFLADSNRVLSPSIRV